MARACRQETREPGISSIHPTGSLTLHDVNTNKTFLIDTGAEVSIVPATDQDWQGAPLERELVAANGSRIRYYGEKKLRLHIGT